MPRLNALCILVTHHHRAKAVSYCIPRLGSCSRFFARPGSSKLWLRSCGFAHVKDHDISKSLSGCCWLSLLSLIHALRHTNEFKLDATLGLCHGRSVPDRLLFAFVLDISEKLTLLPLFLLALPFQNLLCLLISLFLFLLDFALSVEQSLLVLLLLFNVLSHDFLTLVLQVLDLLSSYVLVLHLLHFLLFLYALDT